MTNDATPSWVRRRRVWKGWQFILLGAAISLFGGIFAQAFGNPIEPWRVALMLLFIAIFHGYAVEAGIVAYKRQRDWPRFFMAAWHIGAMYFAMILILQWPESGILIATSLVWALASVAFGLIIAGQSTRRDQANGLDDLYGDDAQRSRFGSALYRLWPLIATGLIAKFIWDIGTGDTVFQPSYVAVQLCLLPNLMRPIYLKEMGHISHIVAAVLSIAALFAAIAL